MSSKSGVSLQDASEKRRKQVVSMRDERRKAQVEEARGKPETEAAALRHLQDAASAAASSTEGDTTSNWEAALGRIAHLSETEAGLATIAPIAIPYCATLLRSRTSSYLKADALHSLTHFASADSGTHITTILQHFPPSCIVPLCSVKDTPHSVRTEAVQLVHCLSEHGTFEVAEVLVECGILREMLLGLKQMDVGCLKGCLDVLYSVLWWGETRAKEAGVSNGFVTIVTELGLDNIEDLETHGCDDVSSAASEVIRAIEVSNLDRAEVLEVDSSARSDFHF